MKKLALPLVIALLLIGGVSALFLHSGGEETPGSTDVSGSPPETDRAVLEFVRQCRELLVAVGDGKMGLSEDVSAVLYRAGITNEELFDRFSAAAFTMELRNTAGETVGETVGLLIREGVGVVRLSALRGVSDVSLTDSAGDKPDFLGILNTDNDRDLVYITLDTGKGGLAFQNTALDELAGNETFDLRTLGRKCWPEEYGTLYPRILDPTMPAVALTFDDGPHATCTPALLDIFEQYGVVATFFEVGSQLAKMPQFLTRMEELGCEVGSHTYSHVYLTDHTAQEIAQELEKTNAIIRNVLGHDASLVRPPYGAVDSAARSAVEFPMICWNVDTEDWRSRDAQAVKAVVMGREDLDGAIILMHSLYGSTVEAVEELIPWLLEQGYQLVTVSELARLKGVEMESGGVYTHFSSK